MKKSKYFKDRKFNKNEIYHILDKLIPNPIKKKNNDKYPLPFPPSPLPFLLKFLSNQTKEKNKLAIHTQLMLALI